MSSEEFRWLLGLNLVVAVWLGMLANSWKGRSLYRWALIGLIFNVAGLLVLVLLPKIKPTPAQQKIIEA